MARIIVLVTCILLFAVGGYIWKIQNTGFEGMALRSDMRSSGVSRIRAIIAEIEGTAITSEDVEWEYQLHTDGIFDNVDLTPIPDLGNRAEEELIPLKKQLAVSIIERKLLFKYIQKDTSFDYNNPSRYTACLREWQDAIETDKPFLVGYENQQRLKSRLCERSILNQFIEDRLHPQVKVSESEIVEYYKNNLTKFRKPSKVTIRQIVLPSEKDAKRVQHGLTRINFAQRAVEHSITPEASDGGRLGPFAKGEVPRVFDVAFRMQRGAISPILKSTYGFHLIMLEKKQDKQDIGLDEAASHVRSLLIRRKREAEYQKWKEAALAAVDVNAPKPLW